MRRREKKMNEYDTTVQCIVCFLSSFFFFVVRYRSLFVLNEREKGMKGKKKKKKFCSTSRLSLNYTVCSFVLPSFCTRQWNSTIFSLIKLVIHMNVGRHLIWKRRCIRTDTRLQIRRMTPSIRVK